MKAAAKTVKDPATVPSAATLQTAAANNPPGVEKGIGRQAPAAAPTKPAPEIVIDAKAKPEAGYKTIRG